MRRLLWVDWRATFMFDGDCVVHAENFGKARGHDDSSTLPLANRSASG